MLVNFLSQRSNSFFHLFHFLAHGDIYLFDLVQLLRNAGDCLVLLNCSLIQPGDFTGKRIHSIHHLSSLALLVYEISVYFSKFILDSRIAYRVILGIFPVKLVQS